MNIDISTEIKVMLVKLDKNLSWLAEQLNISQPNLSAKMKRNNFRVSEMIEIAEILGYDLKIEFIKKTD